MSDPGTALGTVGSATPADTASRDSWPSADDHRRTLIQNVTALFGAQAISLLVPLLTVPYLARVLRPSGWAAVLIAQALASWLTLVIEFGFDLSGTRAVSQARWAPQTMARVVGGIQGAKLLLVPVGGVIMAGVVLALPAVQVDGRLMAWAMAFAVVRGLSPLWYFQGMERVRAAVAVDSGTRAAAALGVFVVVRAPEHGWRVLALQAGFGALSLVILTVLMSREIPWSVPSARSVLDVLRRSSGVFGLRAASGLSVQANTLVVAALASPVNVSFFGGAERIVRASINLLQPLTQAFLPRISYLSVADPTHGRRTIERCLVFVGGLGATFSLGALFGASLLTRVLLGPGYEGAVPVMHVLSALPVLVAVNTVLGLYWAVPFGHDRAFLATVLAGGVANILCALLFVPRWGALGMATAVTLSECLVAVVLTGLFLSRPPGPPATAQPNGGG